MTYEYECEKCQVVEDVSKPVAEIERIEPCPKCDEPMKRLIGSCNINVVLMRMATRARGRHEKWLSDPSVQKDIWSENGDLAMATGKSEDVFHA